MITQSKLKETLHYDPETGVFTWIKLSGNLTPGTVAGCRQPNGYVSIMIDGKPYKAHRLAWLYMKGVFPEDQIDHINGNRSLNNWSNLREANDNQNRYNSTINKNNTSGIRGVRYHKASRKWIAQGMANKKYKHLGCFDSKEDAREARIAFAKQNHGEYYRDTRLYDAGKLK